MSHRIKELEKENEELRQQVAQLTQKVEWLNKQLFGSKSEKLDPSQLELGFENNEIDQEPPEEENVVKFTVEYERERKKKPRLSPEEKFAHLPEKGDPIHIIPPEVLANPDKYRKTGEVSRIEIDRERSKFTKQVYVYEKYVPIDDPSHPPIKAPARPQLVQGSYASINLIVQVIVEKYLYYMPLDRQEKRYKREGAEISKKTMCDWLGHAARKLEGIYKNIQEEIRSKGYVQLDETPYKIIDGVEKLGKTKEARLWLMNDPFGYVYYHWSLSRAASVIDELIGEDWEGIYQTDGYIAYHSHEKKNPKIESIGCWAHVRRKFDEGSKTRTEMMMFVLRRIAYIYHLEGQWGNVSDQERRHLRRKHHTVTLSMIKRVCDHLQQSRDYGHNEKLRDAVRYILNEWSRLIKFVDNGMLLPDNNLVENAVRPTKINQKNCLFVGHKNAGDRTAIFFTIIENCKRYGIDPFVYLNDVFNRLVHEGESSDLINKLMPANWAKYKELEYKEVA